MTATPTPDDGAAVLKPCPFCGAAPAIQDNSATDEGPTIVCHECWLSMGSFATEAEAIAAWNTRSPAPVSGEAAERAAAALCLAYERKEILRSAIGELPGDREAIAAIIRQHCAGAGRG